MRSEADREIWLDDVKVIACILVAFGHFFQSMVKANLLADGALYEYFDRTIYYFHVQLFFIASGYLYQKFSRVRDFRAWGRNVYKKAWALGVPYFTFLILMWLLKTGASADVNGQVEAGLLQTLTAAPIAPYWFLYALFFIFLLTPTFDTKRGVYWAVGVALALRIAGMYWSSGIYPIDIVMTNAIWFTLGMLLCTIDAPRRFRSRKWLAISSAGLLAFLAASAAAGLWLGEGVDNPWLTLLLGVLACASIIMIFSASKPAFPSVWKFLAKYTLPIFLLHTLFAAPLRIALLKLGVHNPAVHVACGLFISIAGPVLAAWVAHRLKWPEFFLYPNRFIKYTTVDEVVR